MTEEPPAVPPSAPRPTRELNPEQERFCQLVATTFRFAQSYRIAYRRPKATKVQAGDRVQEILASPGVRERIAELKRKSVASALLTLNERLGLLAESALRPARTPQAIAARARVIDVYNRTAGDHAPERQEVTVKGDAASPLAVVSRPMTKEEKIEALLAGRRARGAKVGVAPAAPATTEGAA